MKSSLRLLILLAVLALPGLACSAVTRPPQQVVETVVVVMQITATPPAPSIQSTPTPPAEAAATQPEATEVKGTPTLAPIQATLQALREAASTPGGGSSSGPHVDPHDYPAIFELAWKTVQDNYVRDNFNGTDWQAVHDEYKPKVDAVQSQDEFWDLMDAMIAELHDNHSRFVRPNSFSAEFDLPSGGAGQPWPGLILGTEREYDTLLLWNVCEQGPAAQAGLERGDHVLAIDGQPVTKTGEEWDVEQIYGLIYDEDKVTLTVQQGPNQDPKDVTIEFGGASGCDGWSYGVLSSSPYVGYIRIPEFSGNADANIMQAIGFLEEKQPLEGLVLDVRHDPGGNADRATSIFTEGTFGKVGSLRSGATQTIFRIRGPVRWNATTPLALLTDGSSHSASEYFATALQQSGRAVLVGMPTAGNTEGITGFSLPDGSLIRLAVETLVLPNGETMEKTGVIPDVQVPVGDWGLKETPDVQLQAAYDAVVEKINGGTR